MISAFLFAPVLVAAQTTTISDYSRYSNWRRQSNEFQQKVDALGNVAEPSIAMPILFGPVHMLHNYGELRPSGRIHEGEDIMALKGTPVVSPTAAVVIRTNYDTGEGNSVYTENPGGERFIYYHLDRIAEGIAAGQVLARGDLIGYVGNTGDASGGPAHVHFEIRKSDTNAPTDPYPRLTTEFTPEEKMTYLAKILMQTTDPNTLAQFLVTNFRSSFTAAVGRGAVVPPLIVGLLNSIPATAVTSNSSLPVGDLALGSSGALVVQLQQFLITKSIGTEAKNLGFAGATGNFGPLTQAALVEYQTAVGVSPANGYYGPSTQAFVRAGAGNPPVVIAPTTPTSSGVIVVLTRDLYLGISGEDVRSLQKLLNRNGYTVAATGSGSVGNESTYFGPATQRAVIKYQTANRIPAAGYVGIITRASLSLLRM